MNETITRESLNNKNRLSWWFPRLPSDVLVPKTEVIRYDGDNLVSLFDGVISADFIELCERITQAGERLGWPLFLRTDYLSGKHRWKDTCYVPSPDSVKDHVIRLVEESELADMMGFPTDCWIARKLIPTKAAFLAFPGEMPITKERRYFVQDDQVLCHHPYWPPEVFDEVRVSIGGWRKRLDAINYESHEEVCLLSELSSRVCSIIGGAWSIDWLWSSDERKWYLTDMAEAKSSYHWPGCQQPGRVYSG